MTPVDQLVLHDPDDPTRMGDCLRASVAALLDLDPTDVPHFVQDGYHAGDTDDEGEEWYRLLAAWLRDRGYGLLWPTTEDADEYRPWSLLDLCLVTGPSPRGPFSHTVVGRLDGTVVHDPLDVWPRDRRRHHDRAQFSAGWTSTRDLLSRELDHLAARNAVILVDCPPSDVRVDGTYPKANARVGYPGVVVAFDSRDHGPLKYVADRFSTWTDNVRAIALGLEALRKVDRYGITKRGEQYRGWAELPAGIAQPATHMTTDEARELLVDTSSLSEVEVFGTEGGVERAYRLAAKRLHPDHGGDAAQFQQLQTAKALLDREAARD